MWIFDTPVYTAKDIANSELEYFLKNTPFGMSRWRESPTVFTSKSGIDRNVHPSGIGSVTYSVPWQDKQYVGLGTT
jgi:hypothetical protein